VLPETLLRDVGRFLVPVLVFYGALRLVDLWSRGVLVESLRSSYEARMFQTEFLLGVLLPTVLLAIPVVRRAHFGRYAASQLVILGFIINRLNVTITGFEAARGGYYVPALFEILITLMLVGAAMAGFGFAVRTLDIYPDWLGPDAGPAAGVEPAPGPRGDDRHGIHLVRIR
jgi:Ni/Fe-hydrogenase subunit HybB-like protein